MTTLQMKHMTRALIGLSAMLCLCAGDLHARGKAAGNGAAPPKESMTSLAVQVSGPGPTEGWLSSVRENIRRAEYGITWQDSTSLKDIAAAWQASNRAQGFRTYFTEDGVRVIPRTEKKPSWEWGLALVPLSAGGSQQVAVGARHAVPVSVQENRIEFDHDWLTEWYINDEKGLEQGFTIPNPLPAARSSQLAAGEEGNSKLETLNLELHLSGTLHPRISADGQAVDFYKDGGFNVLHYAQLKVTDASGRALSAHFEGWVGSVRPVQSSEFGVQRGEGGLSTLNSELIAALGGGLRIVIDASGAAYPITVDPLLTTPAWTTSIGGYSVSGAGDVNGDGYDDVLVGAPELNAAYLYYGGPSGLGGSFWTYICPVANSQFGVAVSTSGDVNGDGYADVIIGAYQYTNGQAQEGAVFAFYGSPTGLANSPDWIAEGDQGTSYFGYRVSYAGDVNGDGFGDIIVGAERYDFGQADEGAAFVYYGSSTGLLSNWSWHSESDQYDAYMGRGVSAAGDVNGDGYADVIVSAPWWDDVQPARGKVLVFHGSATGLSVTPDWQIVGPASDNMYGLSTASAGDLNGDGYSDIVIGASGVANVYYGSASGILTATETGRCKGGVGATCGWDVGTAGDVNGDGYSEIIVGAPYYSNPQTMEGLAFVWYGGSGALNDEPQWTGEPNIADNFFGFSVSSAGDVNGDGYGDVIVGTRDGGGAYVYYGSPDGLAIAPGWTAAGETAGDHFGFSMATAGDVNGDGYDDVVVGADGYSSATGRAYLYLGGPTGLSTTSSWAAAGEAIGDGFGYFVAPAGDVNGDGYSDVVVAAYGYNSYTGKAYLYLGGPSGLSPTASWTALGELTNNQFSRPVASAGDVNGDGYSDVVVGALGYNSGTGKAYLYLGGPSGLSATAAWTALGENTGNEFGQSVAAAGDVNGDGYSDVIVGAYRYGSLVGKAYLYLGGPSGLSATAAWTAMGEASVNWFGNSVAPAGDVNGDGYSDVVTGAPGFSSNTGKAYLYLGGPAGLSAAASWTAVGETTNNLFGNSVTSAGDVNGDGYSDVVVEAYRYNSWTGKAYLYLGGPSGLSTTSSWTAAGEASDNYFGWSVATAGDVNGDGYSDVVVGAYNNTGSTGKVYLYFGGGGAGVSLRPQQRRSDDSAPIAPLGAGDSIDNFRLSALGRTPFGRGLVKVQWEVKPFGTPFDGIGLQQSASWMDTGTAGVALNELIAGLTANTLYHWKMRLVYDPVTVPFQSHSRWFTAPINGWHEADLRTLAATVDLAVTGLTDVPDPCASGNALTYTATLANNGPDPASGVVLMEDLSGAGLTFVYDPVLSDSRCAYDSGPQRVTCAIGTLGVGAPQIIVTVFTVTGEGQATNTISVVATENDPNSTNNGASAATNIGADPGAFALLSPADGATGQPAALTLDWEDVPEAVTYTLYFGSVSPAPPYQAGLTESKFPLAALSEDTLYFWRVEAINGYGTTSSVEWSFATSCMTEESWWPGGFYGGTWSVRANGNFVYFSSGQYLITADVSGPGNPVKTSEILLQGAIGEGVMALSGNHLFVPAGSEGVLIFDLTDPAHPVQVSALDAPGYGSGEAEVIGDTLYLCAGDGGLRIIDITDLLHPTEIGYYVPPGSPNVRAVGLRTFGIYTYAFITDYNAGIRLLDISNPAAPAEVPSGFIAVEGGMESLELYGTALYAADYGAGLRIFDITDPLNPVERTPYPLDLTEWVSVQGTRAFVPNGAMGLYILDLTMPLAPAELGHWDSPGYAAHGDAAGNAAYLADDFAGLRKLDITNLPVINETGFLDESVSYGFNVVVQGDYAYAAYYTEGMRIFDVSNPAAPAPVGLLNPSGTSVVDIAVEGNAAYLADLAGYLRIVDVSDPYAPVPLGVYEDAARTVATAWPYVYCGVRRWLRILDVSDPANPAVVGAWFAPETIRGVTVGDGFAYVSAGNSGLHVISVTDPRHPFEVSFMDTPGFAYGTVYSDGAILLADGTAGVRLIDVGDPWHPVEYSVFDTPGTARRVSLAGMHLLVADSGSGLRLLDYSDPLNPVEAGAYNSPWPGNTQGAALSGTHAVLADYFGIRIVDMTSCCTAHAGPFQPLGPADGSTLDTCSLTLEWEDSAHALSYDLYLGTGGSTPLFRSGIGLSHAQVSLSPGLAYQWFVVARSACGDSTSPTWSFTTGGAPGAFGLLYPSDGSSDRPGSVLFRWEESAGAESYSFYGGFTPDPPLVQSGLTQTVFDAQGIPPGVILYWRVEAVNSCGVTSSSEWSFTTSCIGETSRHPEGYRGTVRSSLYIGNYLYAANGFALQILDVANPSAPVFMDEILFDAWIDEGVMLLDGGILYVPAQYQGIVIFDVTEPWRPVRLSVFDTPGSLRGGMEKVGNLLYAADHSGVTIVDVSDPANPVGVGYYTPSGLPDLTPMVRDVALSGNILYAADLYHALWIVDVTDPANPVEIAHVELDQYPESLIAEGGRLYLAGGVDDPATQAGLLVYDIATSPSVPVLIGSYLDFSYPEWLELRGNILYVADSGAGLRIFDVTNPAPVQAGLFPSGNMGLHVAVDGARAALAQEYAGLYLLDMSDPSNPVQAGGFDQSHGAYQGVAANGTAAYVAAPIEGLAVLDLTIPASPAQTALLAFNCNTQDAAVDGTRLYTSNWGCNFMIHDLTDPLAPVLMGAAPYSALDAAVQDDYAYLASNRRLRVLDVSDPANPVQTGTLTMPLVTNPRGVAISGRHAYVTNGAEGLHVVDVINPYAPVLTATLDTAGFAGGVAVSDGFAYIADGADGLRVVDVSDPHAPAEVGFFDTPGYARKVALSGGYLFLSDDAGLYILDISTPAVPSQVARYAFPARDSALMGDRVVMADYAGSMDVLDIAACLTQAPGAFNLIAPANGAPNVSCRAALDWQDGPHALSYDIYVDSVNPPLALASSDVRRSELRITLAAGQTYYWKVVAKSPAGPDMESAVWSFTTGAPGAFNLFSPANGAANQPGSLVLDWGDAEGADRYRLYLGTDPAPPLYQDFIPGSEWTVSGLSANTLYYWQVVAVNGCGSSWSKKFQFTVGGADLGFQSYILADNCLSGGAGNGDLIAAPGETLELTVTLFNAGLADATGIGAALTSLTPGVTIVQGWSGYSAIPMGGLGTGAPAYRLLLAETHPCGVPIDLVLEVHADQGNWTSGFQIPVGEATGTVLSESFETWPPAGWTIVDNGGNCVWESTVTTGKPNYAGGVGNAATADSDWCGNGTTMDTELRSPVFDLSFAASATLSFSAAYNDLLPGDGDRFEVDISTDGGASWSNLFRWNESHQPAGPGEPVNLDLSAFVGSQYTQVRFHYFSPDWTWYVQVDEVRIETSPFCWMCACQPPLAFDLTFPSPGYTGVPLEATLDWEDGLGAWTYNLYLGTAPNPPRIQTGLTGSSYAPTGLTQGMTYFWRVEAVNPCGFFSTPERSFTTTCMAPASRWPAEPYGPTRSSVVSGPYAYIGNGLYLQVLDITDPTAPVKVNQIPLPAVMDEGTMAAAGGYLYLCNGPAGLRVYSLADGANPVEVGFYDTPGDARGGLLIQGARAYLSSENDGLHIIDITDPAHPAMIGFHPLRAIRDVEVAGDHAFVVDGYDGMRVLDISNPSAPVEVAFAPMYGDYAEGLELLGDTVFFADGNYGLVAYDVSNPAAPNEVGFYPAELWFEWVEVEGTLAYVPDGLAGLKVLDISNPASITLAGSHDTPGNAMHVWLDAGRAFVSDDYAGLRILDVTDPAAITEVGAFDESIGQYNAVETVGNLAFVTGRMEGLRILNLDDPSHPQEVSVTPVWSSADNVLVAAGRAYVLGLGEGVHILDISDPASPSELGFYDSPGEARGMALEGNMLYVADGWAGLRIVDVADPFAPAEIGSFDTPGRAWGVAVLGRHAYVADRQGGFRIFDVSDPAQILERAALGLPDLALGVAVEDRHAAVACNGAGLRIINVEDPSAPYETGFFDTPGAAYRVGLSGSMALVSDGGSGVRVVDVSDPYGPWEFGAYDTPNSAGDAAVVGEYVVAADGTAVHVLSANACSGGLPGPAALIAPPDGAQNRSCTLTLDWSDGSQAWSYEVLLDTVNPPVASLGAGETGSAVNVSLASGTVYYWRVVSRNFLGTTESPVWSFTTGVPGSFSPLSPPNGAAGQPSSLTLDWSDAEGVEHYDLYLGTSVNPPVYQDGIGSSEFPVSGLAASTTYTWYIVAINECGWHASQKFQFTTGAVQIDYHGHVFTDTCFAGGAGNLSGFAEPGETLDLFALLANSGPADAAGVQAVLSSPTPGITIAPDTAAWPDLPAGGGAVPSLTPFHIAIDPSVPCTTMLEFVLLITSNEGTWPATFQILVGQGTAVLLDDTFETWPPASLQIVHYGGSCDWGSTADTGRPNYSGGNGNAADADSDWCQSGMDTALRTPPMDLPWADAIALTFIASYHDALPGDDLFRVEISTDGGNIWTPLLIWDEDHDPFGPGEGEYLDLTSFAGMRGVQIQIRYTAGAWYWWAEVDDVYIQAYNACWSCCQPRPFNLLAPADQATEVPHTALLDWEDSPGATSYNLYLGTAPAPPLFRSGIPMSQYQVYDLEGHATYYWRVEAVNPCGNTWSPEFSFTTPCVDLVGKWPYGPSQAVAIEGNSVYFGNGSVLVVGSLTDPASPEKLGEIVLPDLVYGIKASGTLLFVADGYAGLRIIDVSDPGNPVEVGFYDGPGFTMDVEVEGSYAFLSSWDAGLKILDISNINHPIEISSFNPSGFITSVAVAGSRLFAASDGFWELDIANPASPFQIGYIDTPQEAYDIVLSGSYAYIADFFSALWIVDISMPGNPFEIGMIDVGNANNLAISEPYVYLAEYGGMRIIDVSIPASPTLVDFLPTTQFGIDVAVSAFYAYLANYSNGLKTIDISNPSAPMEAGGYLTPGDSTKVTISGQHAYLVDSHNGMHILDISILSSPVEVGYYDSPSWARNVVVRGDYAYFAGDDGLRILDVSIPESPSEVGFIATPQAVVGLDIEGPRAYLALFEFGLMVVDVSNPATPIQLGGYSSSIRAEAVDVDGSYAYIADLNGGLQIVDISDPENPIGVGYCSAPSYALDLEVAGSYAFLACDDFGIRIIDLSNPSAPYEAGFFDTPGYAFGLDISGSFLYVADHIGGMRILDISIPTLPIEVGSYSVSGYATDWGVAISGNYAFIAKAEAGMDIYNVSSCCINSPNAFVLSIPANEETNQPLTLELDWQDSAHAMSYDLNLDTVDPPLALAGSNLPVSEFQATLNPGTTYYWRVVAKNGCGTAESAVWSFTTTSGVGPMEVPKGTVQASKSGGDITLSWVATCGVASDYIIYEGTLASLMTGTYDHGTKLCTDAGADLQESFAPIAGDAYYLIVPINAAGIEGDYGFGRPFGANPMGCTINGRLGGECP